MHTFSLPQTIISGDMRLLFIPRAGHPRAKDFTVVTPSEGNEFLRYRLHAAHQAQGGLVINDHRAPLVKAFKNATEAVKGRVANPNQARQLVVDGILPFITREPAFVQVRLRDENVFVNLKPANFQQTHTLFIYDPWAGNSVGDPYWECGSWSEYVLITDKSHRAEHPTRRDGQEMIALLDDEEHIVPKNIPQEAVDRFLSDGTVPTAEEIDQWEQERLEREQRESRKVVTILWNGGWDDYEVNPQKVRWMYPNEDDDPRFPTFGDKDGKWWLKGKFLQSEANQDVVEVTANQCVLIVDRIRGGD